MYQMVHRMSISRLIQLQNNLKGLNKLPRIKEELSNSKIPKVKAVLLILRIVAVLLIHQTVAVLLILRVVAVQIQATLHLPTQPNKIKPHLPQITGSCKISHIYTMIQ